VSDTPEDLITPKEAAAILHCHPGTVYRYIEREELHAWKRGSGRRMLLSRAAVVALLEPVGAKPKEEVVPTRKQESARQRRTREILAKAGMG
jgi:excisionase family DNA binding protein